MKRLWLIYSGVLFISIFHARGADDKSFTRSNAHLRAVETAMQASSTNETNVSSGISNAMCEVRSGIDALSGKNLTDMKNASGLAEQDRQFENLLRNQSNTCGVQVTVAVLLDSSSVDDLVRQAAYKMLMTRDRYAIDDLGQLCRAMAFQPLHEMDTPARRVWLSVAMFRSRMEPIIMDILNLSPTDAAEAGASPQLARTQPLEWLTRVLRKAESRESDGVRLEHIRSAMANLHSE